MTVTLHMPQFVLVRRRFISRLKRYFTIANILVCTSTALIFICAAGPYVEASPGRNSCSAIFSSEGIVDALISRVSAGGVDAAIVSEKLEFQTTDLPRVRSFESDDKRRIEKALQVRALLENVPKSAGVRTVVYMASGYDSTSPYHVFKNAIQVIAIDQHPFSLNPLKPLELKRPLDRSYAWTVWGEVDDAGSLAPSIIGRLKSELPNFRLKKVLAFNEPAQDVLRAPGDMYNRTFETEHRVVSHGLIEFDTGPGSTVRQYIHIDSAIPADNREAPRPWWTDMLVRSPPDAILAKGAMNTYGTDFIFNDHSSAAEVTEALARRGGIIVDGDGILWPWTRQMAHLHPNRDFPKIIRHQTSLFNFGYGSLTIYEIIGDSN